MKLLSFFLTIILFISCNEKINNDNEFTLKISENSKPFCDLIEDVKFIDLEASKESLLGRISNVKIKNDIIFIHDSKAKSILLFNYSNGKYISKVQSIGNGPGEYLGIQAFEVLEEKGVIEIFDRTLKKLFQFDFDGHFLKARKLPFYANSFTYLKDDNMFFSNYSKSGVEFDYQAIITDSILNIKKKYLKIERFTSMLVKQSNQISKLEDDGVLFLPTNSPYAYKIDKDSIYKQYYFNFLTKWDNEIFYENVNNPLQLINKAEKKKLVLGLGLTENQSFILFDYIYNKDHSIGYIQKKSGKINYLKNTKKGLGNKLFIKGSYKDYFISYKNTDDLKSIIVKEDECINSSYRQMILNLNDNDNQVLMLFKFKNNL